MQSRIISSMLIFIIMFTTIAAGFSPTSAKLFNVEAASAVSGPDITLSNAAFPENSNANLTIGTLGVSGSEWGGTTPTFTLISGEGSDDNYAFKVTGTNLQTKLSGIFDFENQNTYTILLRATTSSYTASKVFIISLTNVNEAPAISQIENQVMTEDTPLDIPVSAIDPEGVSPVFSVIGGSSTSIVATMLNETTIRLTPAANFNTSTPIAFDARATDGTQSNLGSFSQFTVTVSPVNDAPVANDSTTNATEDTTVTGSLIANDVDGDTITYSIVTQPSKGTVTLNNASTGAFTYVPKANEFGTDNFTFRASDGQLQSNTATMLVQINGVNDGPTDLSLSSNSIAENNSVGATIGNFVGVDIDSELLTYTLESGSGDTDNSSFTISDNQLKAASSFNFEAKSSYSIRAQVSDGFLNYQKAFAISIANVNESATSITLSSSSLAENSAVNASIGTFSNNDPEQSDTFTYSLVSGVGATDNSNFNISGNTLRVSNSLDFETKNSYSILVRVSDGQLNYDQSFTINLTNVNETPTAISLSSSSINENNATGANVGILSTTDPDANNTFTYTLVAGTGSTDNSSFTISNANLNANVVFNHETKNSYSIRIRSTDQGGLMFDQVFTITINNVNETPTDITLTSTSIAENNATGATVGQFSTTDPDASNTFTYSLVSGTGSTNNSSFTVNGSALNAAVVFNFETKSSYSIRVRTTDQGTLTFEKVFTITVTNVNEPPTAMALTSSTIAENNTVGATIGTLSTTDPDAGATFTYSLVAGTGSTDNASFSISGATLSATQAFNFETKNSYSIRVQSTDQGGLSFERTFTITVSNVNEQPTDISLSNSSINENNVANASIGTFSTTDPDASNTFTYTLTTGTGSTDNASFTITGSSLTIKSATNFEVKNSYSIRVRTTDQGSLTFDKVFTITVNDVNEAPSAITLSNSSIAENNSPGATVGTFSSTDQDASNTFTYTLVTGTGSTDNASFSITGNALAIVPAANFEMKSSYAIRVRSTDQGNLTFDQTFTISVTDVNEAPFDISMRDNTITENNAVGAVISLLTTSDLDSNNTFTLVFVNGAGSTDNDSFTISNSNLLAAISFDYEVKNSYSIRVKTTDQGGLSFEKVLTVIINDINESPSALSISNQTIAENNAVGITVGTLSTTDQDTSNTFTYSLVAGTGSTDNSNFTIDGTSLKAGISFNYETKNSYSIRIRTTDQGGLSFERAFTISVTNVNETPTAITLSSSSIAENNSPGATVGTFASTDEDLSNTFTYSLVNGSGSTDNGSFTINGSSLNVNSSLNFETKSSYSIRVQTADQDGLSFEQTFTITVTNVNEAPTALTLSNSEIDENNAAGATIGAFSTTDPDASSTFTYTLVNGTGSTDNSSFSISGANLLAGSSLNFESKSAYAIRVRTTDQGGLTFENTFTITILDLNEAPTALTISGSSIAENNTAGATIGTLSTTDPDAGNSHTYSFVAGIGSTDNSSFAITGSTLTVNNTLNFEGKSSYEIRVRTTDQNGLTFDQTFTVTVTNVNETPTDIQLSSTSINENNAVGATVATLSTTDPDASNTFTYSLVAGTGSADNGAFTIAGSSLTANSAFNFETKSSYLIRLRTTDQGGLSHEQAFTITVANVNETPTTLTLSNSSINENNLSGATIGTLSTTDPDSSNTFTYSLVAGVGSTDNASFTINGANVTVNNSLNFETKSSYAIRVRTTDQGGLFLEQTFTITVNDVNENPTGIIISSLSIAENNSPNAVVGTLSTADPDANNTFTYALINGVGSTDNASFSVSGNSLLVKNTLNFETKSSYLIRLKTTDQGSMFFEQPFTITVTNVNETPTAIALSATSIAENNTVGATIGTLSTTDPDSGNTFTYTLVPGTGSTDNAAFTISGASLNAAQAFNFESKTSYAIRVRSTDQGGLTVEQTFTVTITNVNETPTALILSATSINENNAVNAIVGAFSTTDSDAASTFTYSLVIGTGSTDNSSFNINNGNLRATAAFNFESKSSYSIRVRTTDQGGLFFEQTFTITVNNVNEAPTALTLSSTSIAENNLAGATIGTFSTSDADAGNTQTYALASGIGSTDNGNFVITANTLQVNTTFDFESKSSYAIRVSTTDQDGLSFEQTFTIQVTNVNEAPTDIVLSNNSVKENAGPNATVGTFTTTDVDAGSTFTYTLVSGAGSTHNNKFNISGNTLRATASLDFESLPIMSVRVRTSDGALNFEKEFTINVVNVNEAPTEILLTPSAIDENAPTNSIVGLLSHNAPDGENTFSFALVSGAGSTDNNQFTISGNNLLAKSGFDYETKNTYSVRVRVSNSEFTLDRALSISVNDINEAPTAIELSNYMIDENNIVGEIVGAFSASDPDALSQFTYTFAEGEGDIDNEKFSIVDNILYAQQSFNYENQIELTVRIQVSDSELTYEESFSIYVLDVNEAATDILLSNNEIIENSPVNTVIGLLSSNDPEGGTITYSLIPGEGSTDNSSFNISGNKLRTSSIFDYETKNSYAIRVEVTDGELSYQESLMIHVMNGNEPPTSLTLSHNRVDENVWLNYTIGEFSSTDPDDSSSTASYTLVSGEGADDNDNFLIVGNKLKTNIDFDFVTQSVHLIRVRVTDSGNKYYEESFKIQVSQSNAVLNLTNNVVTIYFAENIINAKATLEDLKNNIKISNNANQETPTFNDINTIDIRIKKNTLVLTFKDAIVGQFNQIKILGGTLKDSFNNVFPTDQLTSPLVVDELGPNLVRARFIGKKNNEIELTFNEKIQMASTDKDKALKFKAAFLFSKDASSPTPTFSALGAKDKVSIGQRTVKVKFGTPLTGSDNKFIIAAGALKDLIGNKNIEIETSTIALDAVGPELKKVSLAPDNKTITILFSEEVFFTVVGKTKKQSLALMKEVIALTTNANSAVPVYNILGPSDVLEIKKDTMTIRLANPLSGDFNRILIPEDMLWDLVGNKNVNLITSAIVADETGPVFTSVTLPPKKANLQIIITMNEEIYNASTVDKSQLKAALKAAVTISADAASETPTFSALGATDRVSIKNKKRQILIDLSTKLLKDTNYKVKLNAEILKDLTGNKSLEIETPIFTIDVTGPELR